MRGSRSPLQRGYHARPSDNRAGLWRFEADATVAGEIVQPISYDEPRTWAQLAQVCEIVRRHGGVATGRTGGHVHVGVGDFDHTVGNHNNMLALFHAHEDVLYRLAQNPERPRHRGLAWCAPNRVAAAPYPDAESVHFSNRSHAIGVNFESVTGRQTDHVEFRMWDSSLDPGVIQAQVKLSLGLAHAAFRSMGERWGSQEAIGTHRERNASLGRGRRLRADAWRADTAGFRTLVDRIFVRDEDKAQATAVFAATRWQRRR
ncbi:MAG: amidoligase family protein [Actinomycetota bacterium]